MFPDILFEHSFPLLAIAGIVTTAIALGALWFWYYLEFNASVLIVAILRILFFLLLGFCLLLPMMKKSQTELLKPRFLVAVDISESMKMAPADYATNRWLVVRQVLEQPWVKSLSDQCDIEIFPFAGELGNKTPRTEVVALAPDGKSSLVRASLGKLVERYRGQNVTGLLLLTDGLDTREAAEDWTAGPWPFPIYTVRLEPDGLWEVEPDLRVDSVETPRRVVVGWDNELKAIVSGQGTKGAPVEVQLFENDTLIQTLPIQLTDEGARETVFRLSHPVTGSFTYTIKVPPLPRESQTNDNTYSVTVQVIDAKNRLLYLEGNPRWESKYLVRVLKANKEISPVCFVRGPGGLFITLGTKSQKMPELTKDQLLNFKIVIVGDLDAAELGASRAEALAAFVEAGGSLVLIGGPKGWGANGFFETPLNKVLPIRRGNAMPIEEGQYSLLLTDEGRAHPAFLAGPDGWTNVPPVLSRVPVTSLSPGAVALATTAAGAGQPIIVSQKFGQGKVVTILTDSLWRWQLQPGRDNPYLRFWNQLLLWLTPTEEASKDNQLDLFADADRLFLGEVLNLNARLGGKDTVGDAAPKPAVTCEIQTPDNRRLPFAMAHEYITTATGVKFPGYRLAFTAQTPGLHKAMATTEIGGRKLDSGSFSFFIKPFTPESAPRSPAVKVLTSIATASKGQFCEPDELNDLLSALQVKSDEEEKVSYKSLWNNWPIMACLIALIALEWVIRKLKNMT